MVPDLDFKVTVLFELSKRFKVEAYRPTICKAYYVREKNFLKMTRGGMLQGASPNAKYVAFPGYFCAFPFLGPPYI